MSLNKINITVAGATGYVGLDLIKILSSHPRARIKYLCAQKNIGKNIQFFDKRIKKRLPKISNLKNVNWNEIDVLFCSLPTGASQILAKKLIKKYNLKIIDLSADFRLTNKKDFYKFYKLKHSAPELLKLSKYSLTEFAKKDLKKFKIIACPGCYPTSIIIPLFPLFKGKFIQKDKVIIDSKSGYSGAGRSILKEAKKMKLFESLKPYGMPNHRHNAEINQELSFLHKNFNFTPHILPMFRGILSSIYVKKSKNNPSTKKILNFLKKFYRKQKFVRIYKKNALIGTKNVINTNYCDISICETNDKNNLVILSAIDNLIKGGAGQAIQNLNIKFGFNIDEGLN